MSVVACPNCQGPIDGEDRFCGACGARLPEAAPPARPQRAAPPAQPVERGELLWSTPLAGDLAEVVADEDGRRTLPSPDAREAVLVVARATIDESELDEDEDGVDIGVESSVVAALDASSGEKIWSAGLGAELVTAQALAPDRLALYLHTRGEVVGLDRAGGRPAWKRALEHAGESILAAPWADSLYVADGRTLLALSGRTGEPRWQAELEAVVSSVAASEPAVLAATESGRLVAFEPGRGDRLWQQEQAGSRLWPFDGLVLVAAPRGKQESLVAFDLASGEELWRLTLETHIGAILRDGRFVFLHGLDERVRAIDVASGTELWSLSEVPSLGTYCWAEGGLLLVEAGERLVSLEPADGRVQWEGPVAEYEVQCVAIDTSARIVYVATDEGRVAALDASTGSTRWELTLPSRTVENIIIDEHKNVERTEMTVEAEVNQLIPDGRGRLFALADGILFAIG